MHRTSPKTRSLSLQRETVRVLASADLTSVQGGAVYQRISTGEHQCGITAIQTSIITSTITGPSNGAGNCTGEPSTGLTDVIRTSIRIP
jgi:hypothetical protein